MKLLYLKILGTLLVLLLFIMLFFRKKVENFGLDDLVNVPPNLAIVSEKLDELQKKMKGFELSKDDDEKILINGVDISTLEGRIKNIENKVNYMHEQMSIAS